MEKCEFEERDFEGALYHHLAGSSPNLWTPGQVLEGHLGPDAAILVTHPIFWRYFGILTPPIPIALADPYWNLSTAFGGVRLPKFSVNALLQAKRPEFLQTRRKLLASNGIRGPYWRFETVRHQQALLYRLHSVLQNRAIVSYVSTAFHAWKELDDHITNSTLVENCTFVSVAQMNGHTHWCYSHPGSSGIACSDPGPVEEPGFLDQVVQASRLASEFDSSDVQAANYLAELSKLSLQVATEEADLNNPIATAIIRRRSIVDSIGLRNSATAFFFAFPHFHKHDRYLVACDRRKRVEHP